MNKYQISKNNSQIQIIPNVLINQTAHIKEFV